METTDISEEIKTLGELIAASRKIVFFGGAGVSTESGIPDFRSSRGVYSEEYRGLSPEEIISHEFFCSRPELFFRFYREKLVFPEAKPNGAHRALAELEKAGKLSAVVTQNIDGLHTEAGCRKVFELHGSVRRNTCLRCGRKYGLDAVMSTDGIPLCPECGGIIKPDVVLYGEQLPSDAVEGALDAIEKADLLIIAGTSLAVYPAAGFINSFTGRASVVINLTPTSADRKADLVIHGKVGEVMGKAVKS